MEDIINKLAEIEAAASHIMEDVAEQKKQLALEYDQAVQDFDQSIDEEIQKKTARIRQELEVQMKDKLATQESETARTLKQMEDHYQEHHQELATEIYNRILRM
ncbi:MAG TPA: hypothetical protein H9935_02335 [Candidatus Blautia merdigallinarum]|uniref:ATPase n=1 Tax=Candidatus Blautia merdigallinarum TaxID=2838495 RepID=A0A9D2N2E3_9FIRM|nr:hypothetical protein [Candidatus Blautia merdigallinarum]